MENGKINLHPLQLHDITLLASSFTEDSYNLKAYFQVHCQTRRELNTDHKTLEMLSNLKFPRTADCLHELTQNILK